MYATAHEVTRADLTGVNAFLFLHGEDFPWPNDPTALADTDPGTLEREVVNIPPGQNPVRAYLDVLAPDGTPIPLVVGALDVLREQLSALRNPISLTSGTVLVRFGVQLGLEGDREAVLERLAVPLLRLLQRSEG